MAEGVKGAHKFFWNLVDNWKKNTDAELSLSSTNGHLMVKYSVNLGVRVPPTPKPPSDNAIRGHQGPRNRVGPSPCPGCSPPQISRLIGLGRPQQAAPAGEKSC